MSQRDVILAYFQCLNEKKDWEGYLSDDLVFTSPNQTIKGKRKYIESTKGFFQMVTGVEIKDLIVEGTKACAITSYAMRSSKGNLFKDTGVAEFFTLKNNKIDSLTIYFDTVPYAAFRELE